MLPGNDEMTRSNSGVTTTNEHGYCIKSGFACSNIPLSIRQAVWPCWNMIEQYCYFTNPVLMIMLTVSLQRCWANNPVEFKWLLWDSELGWRIIMRCFSEWRTILDKQRKIYLARLGFEPATFGLLVRCSANWATGQVLNVWRLLSRYGRN